MDTVKLLQVIETTLLRRGEGRNADPIRIVRQYWAPDGKLLAEVDDWLEVERPRLEAERVELERNLRREINRLGETIDGAQDHANQLKDENCRLKLEVWKEVAPLVSEVRTFVKRCALGEVRSSKSRAAFENALKHLSEGLVDYVKEKEEGR